MSNIDQKPFYFNAFMAATQIDFKKLSLRTHRSQLPKEPKTWNEFLIHPHREGFQKAMDKEHGTLGGRGTWEEIPKESASTNILPLMWVWKYKYDEDGFLSLYKARLVVRGDL